MPVAGAGQPDLDVAVVGDGPAGAALAAACRGAGLAAVLIGPGRPWAPTYGTWRDDVEQLPDSVFSSISDRVVVVGDRRHDLSRAYGIVDNDRLASQLTDGVERHRSMAFGVEHTAWGARVHTGAGAVDARAVIDATGPGGLGGDGPRTPEGAGHGGPRAWQTAYGVVLRELPTGVEIASDAVTLMDFRPGVTGDVGCAVPTFCYVVPVADGWLVEETVLAARPAVDPEVLRARLVDRLGTDGEELVRSASRVETVRIPMGARLPARATTPVPFGAAAGLVHPASGYSVAASIRAAPRVAAAIADGRRGPDLVDAIWPRSHRRARVLHDYGLDVLVRLDPASTRTFFDAFFGLPEASWRDYLRVDTTPGAVAVVMREVFRALPWSVRRRLMSGSPRSLIRLMRP